MQPLTKKFYRISEVSQMLDIPVSTLRWWDKEFEDLDATRKNGTGWRRYSQEDIELVRRIADLLYNQGLSIEAANRRLKETKPNAYPIVCRSAEDAVKVAERLKEAVKDNPQAVMLADALRRWVKRTSQNQPNVVDPE